MELRGRHPDRAEKLIVATCQIHFTCFTKRSSLAYRPSQSGGGQDNRRLKEVEKKFKRDAIIGGEEKILLCNLVFHLLICQVSKRIVA